MVAEKTTKKTTSTKKPPTAKSMVKVDVSPKTELKVKPTTATQKTSVSTTKKASLEIPVYDLAGKEEKTINLVEGIFNIEASPRLIAQYVRVYLANQRQGTHSTKSRAEVIGTTKKIYRQKGTGGARHGSQKAPIYVGGGVDSGPKPVDHSLKINKKQRNKVLLAVLSMKAKQNGIAALGENIISMTPKTKSFVELLKVIGAHDKKTMIVVAKATEGMHLSVRNLKQVEMVSTSNLNPYNVLNNEKLLFTEEALNVLSTLYLKK